MLCNTPLVGERFATFGSEKRSRISASVIRQKAYLTTDNARLNIIFKTQ